MFQPELETPYPSLKHQLEMLVYIMVRGGIEYEEAVTEFRKQFLLAVLTEHKGNQARAARVLGIHRNTLLRTLKGLKIDCRELRRAGERQRRLRFQQNGSRGVKPARKAAA